MALFGKPSTQDEQRAIAYRDWLRARHPLAIASLVLGVFSLIEFGALLVFGIAGIVLGVMALRQLGSEPADPRPDVEPPAAPAPAVLDYQPSAVKPVYTHGRGLAWGGIVTSVVSLVLAAVLYLRILG